ncbi:EamA family transporter [Haloarchaeobius sp. FL176]|uniref:EamA family transporter n=1 Tax=Haloarchaeobius sp. FL176 TaxID=2967129 RepID=UPI0021492FF7|nr:DMT family transporter [Haloarchaeobius sp. FL176]
MATSPVVLALVAMLAWGLWAVLADVATQSTSPTVAMIVSYLVGTTLAGVYVLTRPDPVTYTRDGLLLAVAAGVFSGIAAVAFYAGLERGSTGVVTTVSALYFVVAAALGVVLFDEPVTLQRLGGVGFAVVAVALLAN